MHDPSQKKNDNPAPELEVKLVFAALPVLYAALIWIYWFGGWQALGS